MPFQKIAVSSPSFCKNALLVSELKSTFHDSQIELNSSGNHLKGNDLIQFFQGADAIIVGTEIINRDIINPLENLKILSKYGVGMDNIDTTYLEEKRIHFHWKGGVNRRSVSEMSLAFLIGLSRNLFFTNSKLKSGHWIKNGGFELSGKTIGIIGCGFIGEDLIRLLQPFHCNILINDIVDKSEVVSCYGVKQVELDYLISNSDLISLHVPLTTKTRGLVDKKFLSNMKKNSYLINTCRGGVINEEDLKDFLNRSLIHAQDATLMGAALDVLAIEPSFDIEFLNLPNLFVTPHIGGNAMEAVLAMGRSAINGLKIYIK